MEKTPRRQVMQEKKKKAATRQRFRSIVRCVMFNRIWLMDSGDQKISLNVKKNIAMLVRTQRKIGMLTITEKTLIRTPHSLRTVEERKKLVRLLADMICFSRIPPKVRARLVPVIKFLVLGPGRKIIREGDPPRTCYFILSGEVEISHKVFDAVTNSYVEKSEFINGPGDCFGDVELIEECDRINTFTTLSEVELLVVFQEDFEHILRPVMAMQHWDKKAAFKNLHYFQYLTEEQLLAGCKIATIKQFEPLETIYHEDKGHLSYSHFVISGECMILQCIKMHVKMKKGVKAFELLDAKEDTLFQDISSQEAIRKLREEEMGNSHPNYDTEIDISSADDVTETYQSRRTTMRTMNIRDMEIACGFRKATPETSRTTIGDEGMEEEEEEEDMYYEKESDESEFYAEFESKIQRLLKHGSASIRKSQVKDIMTLEGKRDIKVVDPKTRTFVRTSQDTTPDKITYENRFIDVGAFTFGGVFGLGEKLEHRVIMARTTVQCLMIPRFWLFEKEQNLSNQWQRRKFYLESTIPSRDTLFHDFLTTRKWQKFKNDLIDSNVSHYCGNPTKVQDIPIFCRIVEAPDE